MNQHQAHQADLEKHHGLITDAEREAQAHRAKADDARRQAEGLPGCVQDSRCPQHILLQQSEAALLLAPNRPGCSPEQSRLWGL